MPNWVYNSLTIDGNESDIAKLKLQLNKPFVRQHDQWNPETGKISALVNAKALKVLEASMGGSGDDIVHRSDAEMTRGFYRTFQNR